MKGIPKETVILIAIILLVFALLYIAWTKGLLPFGIATSEGECYTEVMRKCSELSARGDIMRLQTVLKNCWVYISKLPSTANCAKCKDIQNPQGIPEECNACCGQDLAGWTVR
jgi:hypothetical protein